MKPAYILLSIFHSLKRKRLVLWLLILTVSALGPLITTYIFSRGVNALETQQGLKVVLQIFLALLLVSSVETFVRLAAKTRIHYLLDSGLINLQQGLLKNVKVRSKFRKSTIQSIRNLTRSIQLFSTYFVNNGVAGLVSFVSVPFILFFIDKQIFYVELALIFIYLIITFYFSVTYETQYERFDETREKYFIEMSTSNKVIRRGRRMSRAVYNLQNIRFYQWTASQNMILLFQFFITAMIVIDVVNGSKGISDLVLIIGYTKESQKFLNSITSDVNRIMQIKAGIERLTVTSQGAKEGSVLSIR